MVTGFIEVIAKQTKKIEEKNQYKTFVTLVKNKVILNYHFSKHGNLEKRKFS